MKFTLAVLILVSLFVFAATNKANMPPRDPCRKSLAEVCMETEGCAVTALELKRITDRRETLAEICPAE